ncbi:GerAB/ArcD/ProY family transporter [Paenibacillus cremeus]|nr:endospore germination permease [Paenibacillus cremeus]
MKSFEYGDREMSSTELFFSVASMILGLGILTLPRGLTTTVPSSDGWICIVISGVIAMGIAWILAKLSASFPQQTYVEFSARLVGKPMALGLAALFLVAYICFASYEIRGAAEVSKQYLFKVTPVEVIGLVFTLVVVYGVCGTRIGLLRLNLLFYPIVFGVFLLMLAMNINTFDWEHLKPMGVSHWKEIALGTKESVFSYLGFEVILFYTAMMNRTEKVAQATVWGVGITMVLYLLLFLFVVGAFSAEATAQLTFPTVELAKEIEVPGAIIERLESLFFTIWLMTIFNSAAMALDICATIVNAFVKVRNPKTVVFFLTPFIYFLAFFPDNLAELSDFGTFTSVADLTAGMLIPMVLYGITKIKGVPGHGGN